MKKELSDFLNTYSRYKDELSNIIDIANKLHIKRVEMNIREDSPPNADDDFEMEISY